MVAIFVVATIIVFVTIDYFIQKSAKRRQPALSGEAYRVRFLMPHGFFFGKGHTWVELLPSGNTRIGIDDFVQKIIGKIDEILTPLPGNSVKKGDALFTIRQGDKTLTFRSPVSGKVLDINTEITEVPNFLKHDPYKEGWIAMIEPTSLPVEIREMTIGEQAAKWMRDEVQRFRNFITVAKGNSEQSPEFASVTLMDGGVPINGVLELTSKTLWKDFEEKFLQQE
ncbi:MAG: glycine cleavage system protein H [Candidatus Kryptoniota bacterium]